MKCVKNPNNGDIRRVKEDEAGRLVKLGWSYAPKSEWKSLVKTVN
jgi:hypothetical protein